MTTRSRRDTQRSLTFRSVIARLALMLGAAAAFESDAEAQSGSASARAPFAFRDGVVIDPERDIVLMMTEGRGIEARELRGGRTVWSSDAAAKPLALCGGTLVAQREPSPGEEGLSVALLDIEAGGRLIAGSSTPLPEGIQASIDASASVTFKATAWCSGREAIVVWDYTKSPPKQGLRPITSAPEAAVLVRRESGAARVTLRTGRLEAIARDKVPARPSPVLPERVSSLLREGKLPARPVQAGGVLAVASPESATRDSRLVLRRWDAASGVPLPDVRLEGDGLTIRYPSADERSLLASRVLGPGAGGDPLFEWVFFDLATGRRLAKYKTESVAAWFYLDGDLLVREVRPRIEKVAGAEVLDPLSIAAIDLASGRTLWSRPFRDTAFHGELPPRRDAGQEPEGRPVDPDGSGAAAIPAPGGIDTPSSAQAAAAPAAGFGPAPAPARRATGASAAPAAGDDEEPIAVEPPSAGRAQRRSAPAVVTTDDIAQQAAPIGGFWTSQGPGPTINGQTEGVTPNNEVVGAVHTVVIHPTDPNIHWIGAANGGIWRTNNATAASPTWTPLTDTFPSLSIGAMEGDPTDGTGNTLVAGIGRFSAFTGNPGGPLAGILRTTNGGNTWTMLGQNDLLGTNLTGVAARGATILVSGSSRTGGNPVGVFRSTNTGVDFDNLSGTNGLPNGDVFDLVGDPSNQNRLYATVATQGIFRTDNLGDSWINVTDAAINALVGGGTTNLEAAVHNNAGAGTNAVYLGIINSGVLAGIFRSGNQGGSWVAMDLPRTNEGGGQAVGLHPTPGRPGGQGRTHFSILADQGNQNIVYLCGDRQPQTGANGIEGDGDDAWPNSVGANDFTARCFRGNAGVAPTGGFPSPQWTPLTHVGTMGVSAQHADSREMVFDLSGRIVETDDGGIYRRTSPIDATGDWTSIIGNLRVTEFHDIAWDSNSAIALGGAQDTGTHEQTATGNPVFNDIRGADGGDVCIDDTTLAGFSTRFWSSQSLGGFRRRTCDAANVCGATTPAGLTVGAGDAALATQFVTPVELNRVDATRLIIGGSNAVYESADQGDNLDQITGPGANRNAMVYGHATNADLIVVGSGAQVFVRTAAGGNLTATPGAYPGAGTTITDVAVNPADPAGLYAVDDGNGVYGSTDGGASWTDLAGNLATLGLAQFRTVEYVDGPTNDVLLVGTDGGVMAAIEPHFACWFELGGGLPNVPVWDMEWDPNDFTLIAGTLGRGAWTIQDVDLIEKPVLTIPGDVHFDDTCVGSTSYATLDVCNTGTVNLQITGITPSDPQFAVMTPTPGFPVVISPDFCFPFQVSFTPSSPGPKTATFTVSSNDPCQASIPVDAEGTGTTPDVRVTGSTDFGDVCAGTLAEKTLSVCNVGFCNLSVISVAFDPACADFTLINNPFPAPVSPDSCEDVVIRFTPTSVGPKSCTIKITTDDPDQPIITKTVTASTPAASIDVPPDLGFPPTVISSVGACSTPRPFPVSNTGICPLTITEFEISANPEEYSLSGLPSFPILLEAGHIAGEGDLRAVFAPDSVDRDLPGELTVTWLSDPIAGTSSSITRALCGEGARTGARVLVTAGGVPLAEVTSIKLQRLTANRNKDLLDSIDNARDLPLQTVTPAAPCGAFQFHREYGTVSNPIQLATGSYQVTVTARVGNKNLRKTVGFSVDTCDFNPTVVVNF